MSVWRRLGWLVWRLAVLVLGGAAIGAAAQAMLNQNGWLLLGAATGLASGVFWVGIRDPRR